MAAIKRIFPIGCHVRIYQPPKPLRKRSKQEIWSRQIYTVKGYKTPLLGDKEIGVKLEKISGIFYKRELKRLDIWDAFQNANYIQVVLINIYIVEVPIKCKTLGRQRLTTTSDFINLIIWIEIRKMTLFNNSRHSSVTLNLIGHGFGENPTIFQLISKWLLILVLKD